MSSPRQPASPTRSSSSPLPPTAYREPCRSCADLACRQANGVNAGGPCCFYVEEISTVFSVPPDPEDH